MQRVVKYISYRCTIATPLLSPDSEPENAEEQVAHHNLLPDCNSSELLDNRMQRKVKLLSYTDGTSVSP